MAVIILTSGPDGFYGDSGDSIYGGDGNDTIGDGNGSNLISGDAGDDSLRGEALDTVDGGGGNDTLNAGAGRDTVFGGAGDDIIIGYLGGGHLDGGSGNNSVDYIASTGNHVTIDLVHNQASIFDTTGAVIGVDTLLNIKNALRTNASDTLQGDNDPNRLNGHTGDDVIFGGYGNDTVFGDDGRDLLCGGDDNDSVVGGNANDTLSGGAGNDTLVGGFGDDALSGGAGTDNFVFTFPSGNGADHIVDFAHGIDHLLFTAVDFGVAAGHSLTVAEFTTGSTAVGASAQFIWDPNTHVLYWDYDGAGGDHALALALIDGGAVVTKDDFNFS